MHSSQEMVDNRNECSQNQIFWVGIGALNGQWTSFEVIWVWGQKPLEFIAGPFGTALNANDLSKICQKCIHVYKHLGFLSCLEAILSKYVFIFYI